jgi:hypothetical protein
MSHTAHELLRNFLTAAAALAVITVSAFVVMALI